MIRRDYILRMIEEFIRALARIGALRKGERWKEASEALDVEFKKLVDAGADAVAELSETELLARVISGESTQAVRDKTLILTTLLCEAGEVASAQGHAERGRTFSLKALHLILETLARSEGQEVPQFVPRLEALVQSLGPGQLPVRTQAMLMQHYEAVGEFAKAEDALFALLESEPTQEGIIEFGVAFYERLLSQSDAALGMGNLPRAEVTEGLRELLARRANP